jgi:RLL motif containing protein 1
MSQKSISTWTGSSSSSATPVQQTSPSPVRAKLVMWCRVVRAQQAPHISQPIFLPPLFPPPRADPDEVCTLVAFLEDRHIRALPIEARAPLRRAGDAWAPAFASYLEQIECPLLVAGPDDEAPAASAFSATRTRDYVAWLVAHAFAVDYEDGAPSHNAEAAAYLSHGAAASASVSSSSSSSSSPAPLPAEAQGLLLDLARICRVKAEGKSPSEILQAVHRVLRMWVLPASARAEAGSGGRRRTGAAGSGASASAAGAAAGASAGSAASSSSSSSSSQSGAAASLSDFSAGFSTGNPSLDAASAVLRMLYVADLRELQDAINDIVVTVQDYVADPKTDASLGVVGR